MEATTIKIYPETKRKLDRYREHRAESYNDVIAKVLFIAQNAKEKPALSRETLLQIEQARDRIRQGRLVGEKEARKRLGL